MSEPAVKLSYTPVQSTKPSAVKSIGPHIGGEAKAYLKSRGIPDEVATLFGITDATAFFPDLRHEASGIAFPYYEKTKVYGHKVRALEAKAHVCKPALKTFFGIQLVDMAESTDLIITEGEIDAISFYVAGVQNAISVPNGGSSFGNSDSKDTHGFLFEAKEHIDKAKRILIATDADEVGNKLADELARRVGKHRCWRVNFPEGCKDANDVLVAKGPDALHECIENAEPWPIAGLYEANRFFEETLDLYLNGHSAKVRTGMQNVDSIYSVGKGLLTVVTGIPANGKSTFVDQLMVNLARLNDYRFLICSFENPPASHIAKLAEMLLLKQFFPRQVMGYRMTEKELRATYPFILEHFKFMYQDDGAKSDIDSIIERIKTAVMRWGINGVVVDPYNYIQRGKDAESETQFIDDVLTKLRLLASVYDLHIWFVAHPTKIPMNVDGTYQPPKGYSISGSAAWYAKADFGITVHKVPESSSEVRIINWKTRYNWLGKEGEATILYDEAQCAYVSDVDVFPLTEKDDGERQVQDW